jgi:hypothetical protein
VRVLDIGDAEALQDAPGERRSNDVLHVSIGGERAELRGVCAAGVLGILEWYGGSRLLLGHLEGECFGLFFVRGREGRCIGLYDFDMVRRGDLGEVLAGVGHGWASAAARARVTSSATMPGSGSQAQRAREDDVAAPQTRAAPIGRRSSQVREPRWRPHSPGSASLRRVGPGSRRRRRRIEDHLTVTEPKPATGSGRDPGPQGVQGLAGPRRPRRPDPAPAQLRLAVPARGHRAGRG